MNAENPEGDRLGGLAAQARRGTHWVLATRVLAIAATFASITVLSRLLPPAEFGIWAVAGLVLGLVTILRELGLTAAIVQAPAVSAHDKGAWFWTSVRVSLATAALLALAAPLIAAVYDAAVLRTVIWACCLSVVLNGLMVVPAALLRRELSYERLVAVEGGGMLCGLATALCTAFLWRDVWALVAGHIASAAWMCCAALLLCPWRPGVAGMRGQRDLGFGLQVTGYNVLSYLSGNVGLLAGYRLAPTDLGFFNRGQQLYHAAHFSLLTPITEVGYALLCRLTTDTAYRSAYVGLARRVFVLFIPYAVVLPLVADDLVLALLGPGWEPAVPVLAWFAPAVLAQAFATLLAQVMMSQKRGGELRRFALADLALRGAGAALGAPFGIVGIAAGFSLATFLGSAPLLAWITGRRGPVHLGDHAAALWPGVLLAAAAALAALAAMPVAAALDVPAGWMRLLVVGGSALAAWCALCGTLRPARDALLGRGAALA